MMGMIWPLVRGMLFSGNGMVIAIIAGLVAFGGWRALDKREQRAIGAERAVAEIRSANDAAVKTADRVRAKSRARGVRGPVDPHAVD
jgi:hypothetical protein